MPQRRQSTNEQLELTEARILTKNGHAQKPKVMLSMLALRRGSHELHIDTNSANHSNFEGPVFTNLEAACLNDTQEMQTPNLLIDVAVKNKQVKMSDLIETTS